MSQISWKNNAERYGKIAMSLHWIIAILFLCLYVSVYYRQWFTEAKTPENWTALQLHLSFGVTVMAFVILRVCYKLMDVAPNPAPGPRFEQLGAKLAHKFLYLIMIVMPLTGYFGTGVDTEFFFLFDIPQFRETLLYQAVITDWLNLTWEQFEPPVDFIHKEGGAYVVWVFILLHMSAALYHHFHHRDNVLRRMLPTQLK